MSIRKVFLDWLEHEPDLVYPTFHLHDTGVQLRVPDVGYHTSEFCVALRHSGTWMPPYSIERLNRSLEQLHLQFGFEQISRFEKMDEYLFYGILIKDETIDTSVNGLRACGIQVNTSNFDLAPDHQITVHRCVLVNVLPCKLLLKRHTLDDFPQAGLDNPTLWDWIMLSTIR